MSKGALLASTVTMMGGIFLRFSGMEYINYYIGCKHHLCPPLNSRARWLWLHYLVCWMLQSFVSEGALLLIFFPPGLALAYWCNVTYFTTEMTFSILETAHGNSPQQWHGSTLCQPMSLRFLICTPSLSLHGCS